MRNGEELNRARDLGPKFANLHHFLNGRCGHCIDSADYSLRQIRARRRADTRGAVSVT